jgi:chromosome segregation ATPase
MKVLFSALAVCVAVLTAVITLREEIRSEGKRTRAAISKSQAEPQELSVEAASVVQKLTAIQAQLSSLSRRLAQLEEVSARPSRPLTAPASADPLQAELRALSSSVRGVSDSLARLGGVPGHLGELTTYLDRSFDHLEKQVTDKSTPEDLRVSLDWLVQRVDDIDHYFTPLYAFLGIVYDPANEDVVKQYPSMDARFNDVAAQLETLQKAVADIRKNMIVTTVVEPSRYPRK